MTSAPISTAILGASGYTGYELIRLLGAHPRFQIQSLIAHQHAGKTLAEVFGGFVGAHFPTLTTLDDPALAQVEAIFAALPHGTTQSTIKHLLEVNPRCKIVDLSADFRFHDLDLYAQTYGAPHAAPHWQAQAIYGLCESFAPHQTTRLVANPGCYPTASLLPLIPLLQAQAIEEAPITIFAASGTSGAGKSLKPGLTFTEMATRFHPYAVGAHRHGPEIDHVLANATGAKVTCSFTPHLLPVPRGLIATIAVDLQARTTVEDLRQILTDSYQQSAFVKILNPEHCPDIHHVIGTNCCALNVFADRIPGRALLVSAIDNLIKGASGQAIQNMNRLFGLEQTCGLETLVYPL